MQINVFILDRPIRTTPSCPETGAGAVVSFVGIVRPTENGEPISGLVYEAYEPMALEIMRSILAELAEAHPCLCASVEHRVGFVPVGEAAIAVHAKSKHRTEAFQLVQKFMDRLKQDVPIWKVEAVPVKLCAS